VAQVLELAGLSAVARQRIRTFSLGMKQRLGIATALLGEPPVLMFDEPVNGLDADGVRWIRMLLRQLASDGHTVLVSSHLMGEMALTADHLIIIGRGKLLADTPTERLTTSSTRTNVLVRSPRATELAALLTASGGEVTTEDGALVVTGLDTPAIADLAAQHGIAVHELTRRQPSLEQAYLDLTAASTDFRAAELASEPQASR
jgi:ABC-2 type transport system ATP-binding protein